ncbi:MAG: zinc-dependent alcohol dehydrogenase [Planctomycetaceae bacterium]|nr:zinc-dependent alcohol dehydrogenase [Planctomycetaceae bacterium]
MAKTMKAAVVQEFGKPLVIQDVPVPDPGPGQILVKVAASGVCHTDLHAADGDWPVKPKLPLIPGHEGVGPVAALGAGVTDIKEGDLVGVPWLHDACGKCEFCVTGWETVCEKQHNTGYAVDGGYAEYVLAPAAYVGHLPPNTDLVTMAPILCAGVTTYKGLKETEAKPGQWVVISGIGGLGHIAVQYAKAMGLNVGAVDIAEEKLALARSLGADFTANAATEDAVAKVVKETGGGAHGVLVLAVGRAAFGQAVSMARRRGTVTLPVSGRKAVLAWISDREKTHPEPLQVGEWYILNFMLGRPGLPTLAMGRDAEIPMSDIPESGLDTEWVVSSEMVRLDAVPGDSWVERETIGESELWVARFSLHIPREGNSETRRVRVAPANAKHARLDVLVFSRGELYRQFGIDLPVAGS